MKILRVTANGLPLFKEDLDIATYAIDEFIEKIKSEEKIVYLLDNCN